MTRLCENLHEDVHEFMPVTFVVDVGNSASVQEYDKFTTYFNVVEKHKKQTNDPVEARKTLETINKALSTHVNLVEKRRCYRTITLRESMFDGQNIWLLKPSDYNRGRGVSLFNSLEQLKRLIIELTRRQTEAFKDQPQSGGTAQDGGTDPEGTSNIQNVLNQNIKTDVVVI